ncbi:MAG: alkaline phosphatase family protein [Actinomycetota bacterium]|nr:alkaline phosphatase family protein [Actinomycetota bacterium]
MAGLVIGPLLRYAGSTQATVWVETDAPCEVAVLDSVERTFSVEGHHYALILVHDLEEGSVRPYEVHLDGERVWPPDDGRPLCTIHTREHERQARLVFGSCRVGDPQREPYTLPASEHPQGFGVDALWSLSRRLQAGVEAWPDCLLLLGDQVYADEASEETREFMRSRRDVRQPPGEQVADFEEYTRLYREAWSDPDIRWLLSTVPSTMIFDDHDVHDDWNISAAWLRDIRATSWWEDRIVGAFMSYWIYQHIGNLAPSELAGERLLAEVQADDDGGPRLRRFARTADHETTASRFAYHRDFGRSRLVVVDSRAARVLSEGQRDMVDADEWEWIAEHARGAYDHLIIASTVPVFMMEAIHYLEAWNEAICSGAWGGIASRLGERMRRALDLEHWPAFQRSFAEMIDLLHELAEGPDAPGTILIIGGDVHTAYIAEVALGERQESRVSQIVCSPFRNPLETRERRVIRLLGTRPVALLCRGLARAAGVRRPDVSWRFVTPVTFDNSVAVLDLDERRARVTVRRSAPAGDNGPPLETIHERDLTP